jgi:hypothetical protein
MSARSGHGDNVGAAIGRRVADAVERGDEAALRTWLEARD